MLVKARIAKKLAVRSGDGKNGHWEIHPYIIEWEEVGANGVTTQSVKAEFSAKTTKCDELDKIEGLPELIDVSVTFSAELYKEQYYNRVNTYMSDARYRVAKQY